MNEDAYLVEVGHSLFGVFDGLGRDGAGGGRRRSWRSRRFGPPIAITVLATTAPTERAFLALAVGGAGNADRHVPR